MWWNWKRRRRRPRKRPPMSGIHWSQAAWKVPRSQPKRERSREPHVVELTLRHWSSLSPVRPSFPRSAHASASPGPILDWNHAPVTPINDPDTQEGGQSTAIHTLDDWARHHVWDWVLMAWGGIQVWGLLIWCLIRALPDQTRFETVAALVAWSFGWLGGPLILWWAGRRTNASVSLRSAPAPPCSTERVAEASGANANTAWSSAPPTHHQGEAQSEPMGTSPLRQTVESASERQNATAGTPTQDTPEFDLEAIEEDEEEDEVDPLEETRALAILFWGGWAAIGTLIVAAAGFDQFFRTAFDYDGRVVVLVAAPLLSVGWFWSGLLIRRKFVFLGIWFGLLTPLAWLEPGWLEPVILLSWPASSWLGAMWLRARWRRRRRLESRLRTAPTLGVVYAASLQKIARPEEFYED
ncbi:hypothetical protein Isop_1659 [Isosphaera pallida ATCC 43644]|uniref:Uncharacterized protein n=1 Tax=Isosphaera pallida (strain ATCC 43644 / DSM 9630 / IS1B) TaxID=575540 RepID=E8R0B6_ISOPI|nr:hypothetical protein [Isosphaera pallida]ADV62243.1 hypothetical protein Isop_1659 [Isosphaera pallida ATCC 43644]